MRNLTPEETCAMYHHHDEYALLGIGAIAYYKGLSSQDRRFIDDMTVAILKAAQKLCIECDSEILPSQYCMMGHWTGEPVKTPHE